MPSAGRRRARHDFVRAKVSVLRDTRDGFLSSFNKGSRIEKKTTITSLSLERVFPTDGDKATLIMSRCTSCASLPFYLNLNAEFHVLRKIV
jgi:hypothetical protein